MYQAHGNSNKEQFFYQLPWERTAMICNSSTQQLTCTYLNVSAPPSVPNITSLTSIYSDQLTVTWTSVPMATSYSVSINGSTPISLPANANTYTFTGLTNNTVYTVSVVAINCAGNSNAAITTRTSKSGGGSVYAGGRVCWREGVLEGGCVGGRVYWREGVLEGRGKVCWREVY